MESGPRIKKLRIEYEEEEEGGGGDNETTNIVLGCSKRFYDNQTQIVKCLFKAWDGHKHAVIESPTGTGKSMAVACAIREYATRHPGTKFVYLSRTHHQLSQCIDTFSRVDTELRMKGKREINNCLHLFSKRRACLNHQALRMLTERRRQGVRDDDNEESDGEEDEDLVETKFEKICSELTKEKKCIYAPERDSKSMLRGALSIEDFKAKGLSCQECPYHLYSRYRRRLMQSAKQHVTFAPYIYITHSFLYDKFGIFLKGHEKTILIVDEAHNFPRACVDGLSFELSARFTSQLKKQLEKRIAEKPPSGETLSKLLVCLKCFKEMNTVMSEMCKEMYRRELQQQATGGAVDIVCRSVIDGFHERLKDACGRTIDALDDGIVLMHLEQVMEDVQGVLTKATVKLKKLLFYLNNRRYFCYTLRVKHRRRGTDTVVRVDCADAYLLVKSRLERSFTSVVFLSGTLNPLNYVENELGLTRSTSRLLLPHVMQDARRQFKVITVNSGDNETGAPYTFTYGRVSSCPHMYDETCKSIFDSINSLKSKKRDPFGIFIFASNKTLCENTYRYALEKGMYDTGDTFCESTGGKMLSNLHDLDDWIEGRLRSGRCPVCFCYFRGNLAEGIDLADERCRLLFCIGVPFANMKDTRWLNKLNYNERVNEKRMRKVDYGDNLYLQQLAEALGENEEQRPVRMASKGETITFDTSSCVCQAMGRVVRHADDWGCCVLYDDRWRGFVDRYLVRWMRPLVVNVKTPSECTNEVVSFFDNVEKPISFD